MCPAVWRSRVYPRVCGGTTAMSPDVVMEDGLSPRVRGNPGHEVSPFTGAGSIPACAGEPADVDSCSGIQEVYPRVCGGTRNCGKITIRNIGLSPRVRGNRTYSRLEAEIAGSIPACAGEPAYDLMNLLDKQVYPRVCGGTAPTSGPTLQTKGLSPRVRGNPVDRSGRPRHDRSIPACAGEPQ